MSDNIRIQKCSYLIRMITLEGQKNNLAVGGWGLPYNLNMVISTGHISISTQSIMETIQYMHQKWSEEWCEEWKKTAREKEMGSNPGYFLSATQWFNQCVNWVWMLDCWFWKEPLQSNIRKVWGKGISEDSPPSNKQFWRSILEAW